MLNYYIDDKPQLLALAEERKRLSMENERTIQAQKIKITEDEIAATEASEKIKVLEQKLQDASAKEQVLIQQQKEQLKNLFANEMFSYAKKIKRISIGGCCLFALVTIMITIVTGLNYWFCQPFQESW